jgi:hypothetical protein
MGKIQSQPFQLSLNASLKVDFRGSHGTSDGGLIPLRERDGRLRFGERIEQSAAAGLTPAMGRIRSFLSATFCGNPFGQVGALPPVEAMNNLLEVGAVR